MGSSPVAVTQTAMLYRKIKFGKTLEYFLLDAGLKYDPKRTITAYALW